MISTVLVEPQADAISSTTTMKSLYPPLDPPNSSGRVIPVTPKSAKSRN